MHFIAQYIRCLCLEVCLFTSEVQTKCLLWSFTRSYILTVCAQIGVRAPYPQRGKVTGAGYLSFGGAKINLKIGTGSSNIFNPELSIVSGDFEILVMFSSH